jgi:hypothetical protein
MEFVNKTDLLARGWTNSMIAKLLPEPDVAHKRGFYGGYVVYSWKPEDVTKAEASPEFQQASAKLAKRRVTLKRSKEISEFAAFQKTLDREEKERLMGFLALQQVGLIPAIRAVSRHAHKLRDQAQEYYQAGNFEGASSRRFAKEQCYALKEQGIVAAFRAGLLRYAGASPQGMAVYEYENGGMSCFHSCLHPEGVPATAVEGHPEVLFVTTKDPDVSPEVAGKALSFFSSETEGMRRVSPPRLPRMLTCWECGGEGHVARECPAAA